MVHHHSSPRKPTHQHADLIKITSKHQCLLCHHVPGEPAACSVRSPGQSHTVLLPVPPVHHDPAFLQPSACCPTRWWQSLFPAGSFSSLSSASLPRKAAFAPATLRACFSLTLQNVPQFDLNVNIRIYSRPPPSDVQLHERWGQVCLRHPKVGKPESPHTVWRHRTEPAALLPFTGCPQRLVASTLHTVH